MGHATAEVDELAMIFLVAGVIFWTSGDLEADQVMMPDQAGGGVSLTFKQPHATGLPEIRRIAIEEAPYRVCDRGPL